MLNTDKFIHSLNVEIFKSRLNVELDQGKRRVLLTLLAEEEAKLHNSLTGAP